MHLIVNVVPPSNSGSEMSFARTDRYRSNVPKAVEHPKKLEKAEPANHLGPEGDKHYEPVKKHSLSGMRGATLSLTEGSRENVTKPTDSSKSVLNEAYAVDTWIRASYLVSLIYR